MRYLRYAWHGQTVYGIEEDGRVRPIVDLVSRAPRDDVPGQPLDAEAYVLGYTCFNDVTARDLQRKDGQWTRGKGFDTFAPIGPWIVAGIAPDGRELRCVVNGEVRQQSNTSQMVEPERE